MIVPALLLAVGKAAQSYPPPFPRIGVTKLLDNERVTVWDYTPPANRRASPRA
jgi:hypothetical protein